MYQHQPYGSATKLVAQLRDGSVTAVELMQATLDRIDALNPGLNAIVALRDRSELMAEAAAADQRTDRGPLHGLPLAIKDLANVKGIASTQGSPLFRDFVPDRDELFVARLRAAGAILIGKTNTPEFGLGSHTFNPVYGVTGNPFDPTVTCGGSSGGAAVALSAGLVALADGSDMMGSLRNPAGWNNVYGFRPTWGWVPSEPQGDLFLHQLSTLGPMARSPEDIALLLDVMAGPDPRQPLARGAEQTAPLPECGPMRIGWLGDWGGAFPMEAGVLDTCVAALDQFRALGHSVEAVAPPFSAEKIWESWITLRSFAVAAGLRGFADRREALKDTAIWELERGLALTGAGIQAASDLRSDWQRAASKLFDSYDALILPTAQCWPFAQDLDYPRQIAGQPMDSYHRWMQVVTPVSLLGLPCLAVPVGFGDTDVSTGLPMGLQIFAPQGHDRRLLALGQNYHQATQWPQKSPPPLR
ncbi:Glutamyl-tRNA(Gln) amidotransferase subunit A [Phaeobacter sp. CECT 5382]|uniref:amidase n=1 Tax=Phaeobacter sp. CECT 5382 TaxID=1712645 RepID=UPI0006DB5633|nr:amidase [Phaeobacter sp. CECT 5382]CUH88583.1 Glutamyl-tRNA(Gln) amidotransferase subunit A [Phaeobacter sp. CECT 5382]